MVAPQSAHRTTTAETAPVTVAAPAPTTPASVAVPVLADGAPSAEALKVFISYSRVDMAAADRMVADLERNGFAVTIDRRDLPYGEEWQAELSGFIAASDTVVWLVSPASVKSKWVNWELGEVGRLSKRLLPVKVAIVDPATLPEALGRIHILPAEGVYEPERHEADLVRALNTDRAWLKKATSLADNARDWITNGRDAARLLRGRALAEAEAWSVRTPRDVPAPASEILELILASRRAQDRRRRMTVAGAIAVAAMAVGLGWYGLDRAAEADNQKRVAEQSEERAVEQAQIAIENETISLNALAQVELSEGRTAEAAKLALSAWPRPGNENRPALRRTAEHMAIALGGLRERNILTGHNNSINWASFSPDSGRIATASYDNSSRIWDAHSGEMLVELLGHRDGVRSSVFSDDGRYVLTASEDGTAKIWDVATGEATTTLVGHSNAVISASFAPGSLQAVTTSSDGTARIWDVESRETILTLNAGFDTIFTSAAFSPDGARLATADSESVATVWSVAGGAPVVNFRGHTDQILSIAFSPDGRKLATASGDGTVRIWDPESGRELMDLGPSEREVKSVRFSPDGRYVVSVSGRSSTVWDTESGAVRTTLGGHLSQVNFADFSPDGRFIVAALDDGTGIIWDVSEQTPVVFIEKGEKEITAAVLTPDKQEILVLSETEFSVFDATSGSETMRVLGRGALFNAAEYSPSGDKIVLSLSDATVRILDSNSGEETRVLRGHSRPVLSAFHSPDGRRIVSASGDGTARVWSAEAGDAELILAGHDEAVASAVFSPDGGRIVTAAGRTVRIWDSRSGESSLEFDVEDAIFSVSFAGFSPDGQRLFTIDPRGVRIWNADNGALLLLLDHFGSGVVHASFSSDGRRIATAGNDGTARIWDASTGALLLTLDGHAQTVRTASLSGDNSRLLTASSDGVRLWDISALENGDAFQVACQRLGNNTSLKDIEERYGLGELTPICGDNPPLPVDWSKLR